MKNLSFKDSKNLVNNNFDLIRLFAATQVALVHSIAHLNLDIHIPLIGYFPGVPIFFFVSGFLISLSYEKSINYKGYFQNRVLRIYPALVVCFIISILSVVYSGFVFNFDFNFIAWMSAQLTFFQFYNPDFLRSYGVGTLNGSLWTIPVEIAFYVILPFIYYLGKKARNLDLILIGSILISIMFDLFFQENRIFFGNEIWFKLFSVSILPYLWMFLIGVLFQRHWTVIEKIVENKFYLWLVFYVCTILAVPYFDFLYGSNHPSIVFFVILVLFLSSFAIHKNGTLSKLLLGNDISYGVYIYHMIVINFMVQSDLTNDKYLLLISVGVTFVLSLLSWKIIEKPFLHLKKKTIHKVL